MDKGKTLLERLYRGEIFPAEDIVPQSKEYQAAVNKESTLRGRLEGKLGERHFNLSDKYEAAVEDVHRLDLQYTYAEGVSFGVRLILETLFVDGKLPPLRKKK